MLPQGQENLGQVTPEAQPAVTPQEVQPKVEAVEGAPAPEAQPAVTPQETQPKIEVEPVRSESVPGSETIQTPVLNNATENNLPTITDKEKSVYTHVESLAASDPAMAVDKLAALRKENLKKHFGVDETIPEKKAA